LKCCWDDDDDGGDAITLLCNRHSSAHREPVYSWCDDGDDGGGMVGVHPSGNWNEKPWRASFWDGWCVSIDRWSPVSCTYYYPY